MTKQNINIEAMQPYKNFLFFSYVIVDGTIKKIMNTNKLDSQISSIHKLLKNDLDFKKGDLYSLESMIKNLKRFSMNIKNTKNEFIYQNALGIDFDELLSFLNSKIIEPTNDLNGDVRQSLENLLTVLTLLNILNSSRYRHFLSHNDSVQNYKTKFSIIQDAYKKNKNTKKYLIEFWNKFHEEKRKMNAENMNDKVYFFFLSFFIKSNIINDYLNVLNIGKDLIIKASPFRQNISNFNFQNKIIWDETNPICKNFKNNLLSNVFNANDLNFLSKEDYKQRKKIVESNIFKVLEFHVNQFNTFLKNKNKFSIKEVILKNSSDYDNLELEYNNWKIGKRTYGKLKKNIIYIIKEKKLGNKITKYKIDPFYISINTILKYYHCCDSSNRNIFNYEDFKELMIRIQNNVKVKEKVNFAFLRCKNCNNKEHINKNESNESNKESFISLNLLEGNRRKINNDFIWFLKLSNHFFEKLKESNENKNENDNTKSSSSRINFLDDENNINELDKIIKSLKNEQLKQNLAKELHNINSLKNNDKKRKQKYYLLKKINSISKKNFDNYIENDNQKENKKLTFLLNKKEYITLIRESFGSSLKSQIKLFLEYKPNHLNNNKIKKVIKKEFSTFLDSYINSGKDNANQMFFDLYQKIWGNNLNKIDKKNNETNYLDVFKKRFSMFLESSKNDQSKSKEKFLYFDYSLIQKIYQKNSSNFEGKLREFIHKYNEMVFYFLEFEYKISKTNNKDSFYNKLKNYFENQYKKFEILIKKTNKIRRHIFHFGEEGYKLVIEYLESKNFLFDYLNKEKYSKEIDNKEELINEFMLKVA